jgi:hypothetical protein
MVLELELRLLHFKTAWACETSKPALSDTCTPVKYKYLLILPKEFRCGSRIKINDPVKTVLIQTTRLRMLKVRGGGEEEEEEEEEEEGDDAGDDDNDDTCNSDAGDAVTEDRAEEEEEGGNTNSEAAAADGDDNDDDGGDAAEDAAGKVAFKTP